MRQYAVERKESGVRLLLPPENATDVKLAGILYQRTEGLTHAGRAGHGEWRCDSLDVERGTVR